MNESPDQSLPTMKALNEQLDYVSDASEIARLRAELAERAKINTSFRLFDLVRFMRSELHAAELIDDEEYAWLCGESPMSAGDGNGSPSRKRLEDYDKLRAELAELRGYVDASQVDSMRADNAHLRAANEMLAKCQFDNCAALLARAERAEAEVKNLRGMRVSWKNNNLLYRAEKAEAEVKRLREALSTIIEEENALAIRSYGLGDIARTALKGTHEQ